MTTPEIIINILSSNMPTITIFVISVFILHRQGKHAAIFICGLACILTVGLIALPVSNYMWSTHSEFMAEGSLNTAIVVFALGILNSIGLGLCLYAFHKRGGNA